MWPWARRPRLQSPPHAQHDEASEARLPRSGWRRPRAGREMSRARSGCQPQQGSAPCVPDGVGSDETSQQHLGQRWQLRGEERKAGALALPAPVLLQKRRMCKRVAVRAQDLGCGCLARRGARTRARRRAPQSQGHGPSCWSTDGPAGAARSSTGVRQTGRERRH